MRELFARFKNFFVFKMSQNKCVSKVCASGELRARSIGNTVKPNEGDTRKTSNQKP
jgi:hypothetical protein